ncbi:hypothetical protein [Vogesella indigofera]|uniref:hypothetical protein n=1 Tax=Vogesella indigofera TaxID=45465 RepID=UPI00234C3EBE|nr:hypothetical protein [Vogesella indigofera]MDC7704428.1 hypothetical protein [Vogesella indigofera]
MSGIPVMSQVSVFATKGKGFFATENTEENKNGESSRKHRGCLSRSAGIGPGVFVCVLQWIPWQKGF